MSAGEFFSWLRAGGFLPFVVLFLSLSATIFLWQSAWQGVHQDLQKEFDFRVRETVHRIQERILAYQQVLLGAHGLFTASQSVERDEFRSYVVSLGLADNYPGIQGVGFSLVIPPSQKEAHISAVRKEGFPQYFIKPEGNREFYTSIIYLEPFSDRNVRAFGYDMYSDSTRREAMSKARDSNITTISGKVKLLQETDKNVQAGFLMYVPFYKNGMSVHDVANRRENLVGWIYATFRMNDFIGGVAGEHSGDFDLEIFDGSEIQDGAMMYDSDTSNNADKQRKQGLQSIQRVQVANHFWTLRFTSMPNLEARFDFSKPQVILWNGIAASILLFFLVFLLGTGKSRAMKIASELETRYKQLMQNANDAILLIDRNIKIVDINEAGLAYFGYARDEILALHLADLHPPTENIDIKQKIGLIRQDGNAQFETTHLTKNGEIIPAEVSASVVFFDGEPFVLAFVRNISERKEAESILRESEERFRVMADSSPTLIWMSGTDNLCYYFNKTWLDFTGRTFEQENGNGWAEGVHPDDLERYLQIYIESFDARKAFGMEYRLRRHDGEYRWILDNGSPRFAPSGEFIGYIGSCVDIHEQIQTQEKLQFSEERWKFAIEAGNDGLWDWNIATGKVFFSPRWKEMLGFRDDEIKNSLDEWSKRVHPDDIGWVTEEIHKHFRKETEAYFSEHRVLCKDGTYKWILDRGKVLTWNSDGTPARMLGTHTDISERKKAEEELRESERKIKAIFNLSFGFVGVLTPEGNIVDANQTALDFIGAELSDVVGKSFWETPWWSYSPEAQEQIRTAVERAAGGEIVHFEAQHPNAAGTLHTIDFSLKPVKDEHGNVLMLIPEGRDITERIVFEKALKESEIKLRTTFDILPVGITITDEAGNLIEGNKASEQILGMSKEEEMRRNYADEKWTIIRPDYSPMPPEEFASVRAMKEQTMINGVLMGLKKSADNITWIIVNAAPLPQKNYGVVISYIDVTTLINIEKELLRTNEELHRSKAELEESGRKLREANASKDKFFSIIAHDLRSPFSGLLGISNILDKELESLSIHEIKEMATALHESANATFQLLLELLEWSRTQSGSIPYHPEKQDLQSIIFECFYSLNNSAANKGITLVNQCEEKQTMYADRNMASTVVRNLVSNAIIPKTNRITKIKFEKVGFKL